MLRYQLDTKFLSDLVRYPQGKVAKRTAVEGEKCICTSIVVAGEFSFGAKKSGSDRLMAQLRAIL